MLENSVQGCYIGQTDHIECYVHGGALSTVRSLRLELVEVITAGAWRGLGWKHLLHA